MDSTMIGILVTGAAGILGLIGTIYKSVRQRLTELEIEMYKRTTFADVRRTVEERMSPVKVEYQSLNRRIDELKAENNKINDKIDELLIICSKLSNGK